MNPHKTEDDLFHPHHHDLVPPPMIINHHHHHHLHQQTESQPSIHNHNHDHNPNHDDPVSFSSLPEIVLFRTSSEESPSHSSSENDDAATNHTNHDDVINKVPNQPPAYISPEPHISTQFYTFNAESHALMIRCILEQRLATPAEIRAATPRAVLKSWRAVWKDRNEDTAYLTAWKRIQDKLTAHVDPASGNEYLCFKNNSQQYVSHFNQWQDIVMNFHGDADLKHLGLKETIERIKQVWTVGAKFYGIPESYIRVCVAACPVCSTSSGSGSRSKRRRFEYTESFDVPAKEVPHRLQQLAAKHKVVLCIRQKYIRYKPFMAEVKDYACHRAGEPAAKKSKMLKREPYASKRCGCGFRIRAIVPIANYNEKDKTFVYQEEGVAVFKLYAVHSGHEPGPLDGNARIIHRLVGSKGGYLMDQDTVYGVREDHEGFGLMGKDESDLQLSVLQQMQELRAEVALLEARIGKVPHELLSSVSQQLFDVLDKVRSVGEDGSKSLGLVSDKPHSDDVLVGESDLVHWRTLGDGPAPNPPSKMQSPPREPDLEPITLSQNPPPATLPPRRQPELQPIRLSASPSPETLSPLSEPELEQHTTHNPPLGQEQLHRYNSTPESPALDFSHHEEEEEEEEEEKHKQPPPVKPHISSAAAPDTESAPSDIGGARKFLRTNLTILKRAKRDNTIKKSLLGFRVCGFVFSLVAFSVLAADKDRGWALDSFNRYKEFSYCLAVNVIVFVYSGFQSCDLAYRLTAGHRKPLQILRYYLDFSLDQILTYLLLSASSSAAVRVDDWQSNWGEDEFPDMAKASVALSFLAFVALGFSSLISGYALYNQK